MPTILVIQHTAGSSPGRLVDWLPAADADHQVVMAADLDAHLATADRPDGVILLGGGFLPDDDAARPFLVRERAFVAESLAAGTPLFGICLGAQLIAHVAGGTVTGSSGETERGSQPVELLPAAAADPVFRPLAAETEMRMIQNHRDSITDLPAGAVLLATSRACRVQALRVGEAAWGVQFHPEAIPARLATWNEAALAAEGFDRDRLMADAQRHDGANAGRARRLIEAFVGVVAGERGSGARPVGMTGTHSDGRPFIGYCVRRAGGARLAELHAGEVVYAASTVKLAVLVAAARALAAGTVGIDTDLVSTDTFRSGVPGAPDYRIAADDVDEGLPPPGTPMGFGAVVERMIVVSSNEATNMVTDHVGLAAVQSALADAQATATTYQAKYSDFAAVAAGARRETTAGDIARLMSAIVVGALVAEPWNGWMIDVLRRQTDRRLTAHLPADGVFGSKSGSVDGIRHDVAFVGEPGPDALVIAVCTRGYTNDEAERIIEAIGALAVALAR